MVCIVFLSNLGDLCDLIPLLLPLIVSDAIREIPLPDMRGKQSHDL